MVVLRRDRQNQRMESGPWPFRAVVAGPSRRSRWPRATAPAAVVVAMLATGCGGGDSASSAGTAGQSGAAAGTTTTSSPTATSATATCGQPTFQSDLMQAINAARQQARSCGATPYPAAAAVAWNEALAAAATSHSADMALHATLSHTGSDGSTLATRASAAGYRYTALAENIAWNYPAVADVMSGWLQSEGHCANLMGAVYRDVGAACVRAADGSTYWTLDLGAP